MSNQQIIEQAKFTYSPLGKAFDKQIKTTEDQVEKQVKALNTLKFDNKLTIKHAIPKSVFDNDEAKEEINKIKEIEKNVDREKLLYKASENTYDFRIFNTIRTFGEDIYIGKITSEESDEDQSDLAVEINKFIKETKPKNYDKKQEKKIVIKNLRDFFNERKWFLVGLKAKYFYQNLQEQAY